MSRLLEVGSKTVPFLSHISRNK